MQYFLNYFRNLVSLLGLDCVL